MLEKGYPCDIANVFRKRGDYRDDKVSFWLNMYGCLVLLDQIKRYRRKYWSYDVTICGSFLEASCVETLQFT